MREIRSLGSVEGARGNSRPYSDPTRVPARGLRALTAPARSSPDGNCVMAPMCVSSGRQAMRVCQEIARRCVYRIGGHDVRDGLAIPGVSPSSIGSATS